MDETHEILEDLGLEKRAIKIYLILIKNNSKTALEISKETKIDRTTVYDLLNKMMHEGFVSSMKKNNSTCFKAISVNDLLIHFRDKIKTLESILPKLKVMENREQNRIDCEIFTGIEGLKTALRDLLNSKQNYRFIGVKEKYEEILSYFNDRGIIKVKESKVIEEAIAMKNEKFAMGSFSLFIN